MPSWRTGVACPALCLLALCAFGQASGQTAAPGSQAKAAVPKKPEPPPPRVLKLAQTIPFPLPTWTGVAASDYCDAEGNIYFVYTAAKPRIIYWPAKQGGQTAATSSGLMPVRLPTSVTDQPITKLSLDSQSVTQYALRSLEGYRAYSRVGFSVDRWGNVYALFSAQRTSVAEEGPGARDYVIVKFNDDGTVDSTVRLRNPPTVRLDAMHFEAFADGNFLVTGTVAPRRRRSSHEAGSSHPRKVIVVGHTPPGFRPFTAIFDGSGRLVQEPELPDDVSPNSPPADAQNEESQGARSGAAKTQGSKTEEPKDLFRTSPGMRWVMAVNNSLMLAGPEDTVYLLRASNPAILYKLSSDGRVIQQARIDYPVKYAHPMQMSLAGPSSLWITFASTTVDRNRNAHSFSTFALVDPDTGKVTATYRLPGKTLAFPVCATGPNDFLFLRGIKNGKLEVAKYVGN